MTLQTQESDTFVH